jgi:hypothetical protein
MIDPGALGTLVIGLEHVRQQQEYVESPRRRVASRTSTGGFSRLIARWLRGLADLVESGPRSRGMAIEG